MDASLTWYSPECRSVFLNSGMWKITTKSKTLAALTGVVSDYKSEQVEFIIVLERKWGSMTGIILLVPINEMHSNFSVKFCQLVLKIWMVLAIIFIFRCYNRCNDIYDYFTILWKELYILLFLVMKMFILSNQNINPQRKVYFQWIKIGFQWNNWIFNQNEMNFQTISCT